MSPLSVQLVVVEHPTCRLQRQLDLQCRCRTPRLSNMSLLSAQLVAVNVSMLRLMFQQVPVDCPSSLLNVQRGALKRATGCR
jgi:hypothetical protein